MLARICSLLRIKPPVIKDEGLLLGSGYSVPNNGEKGWQPGAIFQYTKSNHGAVLYVNEGNVDGCEFKTLSEHIVTLILLQETE